MPLQAALTLARAPFLGCGAGRFSLVLFIRVSFHRMSLVGWEYLKKCLCSSYLCAGSRFGGFLTPWAHPSPADQGPCQQGGTEATHISCPGPRPSTQRGHWPPGACGAGGNHHTGLGRGLMASLSPCRSGGSPWLTGEGEWGTVRMILTQGQGRHGTPSLMGTVGPPEGRSREGVTGWTQW